MSSSNETIFAVSNTSNTISTSHKLIFNKGGNYGCQGECKRLSVEAFIRRTPDAKTQEVTPSCYHIITILKAKKTDKKDIARMLELEFLYCSACAYVFDPVICRGKKRKFCPCCSDRLKLLKTALNQSTAAKIRNTVLIPRV